MKNNKNGITLIALVITIIVLLILAGISISLVTGQNGVLTRAEDASSTYSMASAKEQANMRAAGYVSEYTEKVYVDNDLSIGAMTIGEYVLSQINGKEDGDYSYSVSGSTITVTSKTTGEALASGTIGDDGGIAWNDSVASGGNSGNNSNTGNNNTQNTPSGVTASTVASAPSTYYGKTVNYTGDTSGYTRGWKIFYSDGSNIYLIASDYVENSKLPTTATGASPSETCGFYWDSAPASAQSPILLGKSVSWNTWTDYSSYNNAKCISTLLKTSNWDSFKNSYAEYAIGGPTLEMWINSVNAKYPNERQLATNKGTYGFYVYANGTGSYSSDTGWYVDLSNYKNNPNSTSDNDGINHAVYGDGTEADSLYFPHTEVVSNCLGYWLASPSECGGHDMLNVGYDSFVGCYSYDSYDFGVRPLVCLQFGVSLTEGTGGYDFNLNLE